jgi:hypothetical protein
MKLVGIALLVLGLLAAIYGGFSYTKEETKAEIGPLKVNVEERQRVNIPLWLGLGAIAAGALILVLPRRALPTP